MTDAARELAGRTAPEAGAAVPGPAAPERAARNRAAPERAARNRAAPERAARNRAAPGRAAPGPDAPDGGSVLDRPEVRQAGWAWGDDDAQPPRDAPLPALMSVALRLVGSYIGATSQGTGISPAGLGVLRLLAARDGLKSSEVAARGWWTPGTVTSLVDTLARDGYVERRREPADRRVVRLYLTEAGRRKVEEAIMLIGPRWQDAFGYVDPADEPVIRKFLVDTIDRFGTLIREERGL